MNKIDRSRKDTLEDTMIEYGNKLSDELDADVILINSDLERPLSDYLINVVKSRRRKKNVFLILITFGGDADAAYRIARCLQDSYERFIGFIAGYCKSAGTLCVLGAHEIVMCDIGELGPLDIQVYKKDEIDQLGSGLIANRTLKVLQEQAFRMFEEYFLEIERRSGRQITFKTATEIATKMVVGLLEPLYNQINPMEVGEMARSMEIAAAYGERLMSRSKNYSPKTLELLSETYPSHGFVIDRTEAKKLFNNVRLPSANENNLRQVLTELGYLKVDSIKPIFKFLSEEIKGEDDEESTDSSTTEVAQ